MDSHDGLVSGLPAASVRPPARALEAQARARVGRSRRAPSSNSARPAALRLSRHRHHHSTMDRYTTLAAEQMFEDGRRAGVVDLVLHPPAAFLRNYVLKGGMHGRPARLHHLGDERVLRVPEVREAVGRTGHVRPIRQPSTSTRRRRGAADRTRSSSSSPVSRRLGPARGARRACGRRAEAARAGRTALRRLLAAQRVRRAGGLATGQGAARSCSRTSSTRTIRWRSRWRHGAADEQ